MWKKMKGDEEPEMMIGALVFVIGFALVIVIIFTKFSDFSSVLKTSQDAITAIDEAHKAVACLKGSSDFIDEAAITKAMLDSCGVTYNVYVRVIEIPAKDWLSKISNPDHTVYAPVRVDGQVHMGEVDVKK